MAQTSTDLETRLTQYVSDLNGAVKSREFAPVIKKWFADDGMLNFRHHAEGIEDAKRTWMHLLPQGKQASGAPREVVQFPYKVENGRVFSWRQLQGGNAPKPLYGLQETQFDDHTLISELVIISVPDKPQLEEDPGAPKTRHGRIFSAFAQAFNDYFESGNVDYIAPWAAPDIRMDLDNTFFGMAIVAHYSRIAESARLSASDIAVSGDNKVSAVLGFENWGGAGGGAPSEITFNPDGKIQQLLMRLEF